jgi:hypothetical protein
MRGFLHFWRKLRGFKWKDIASFVQTVGSFLTVAGVILVGVEYFLHKPIFYNPSKDLILRYNSDVRPLVELADQSTPEIISAVANNDEAAFQKAVLDFIDSNKLRGKIILATETVEHIIDCHRSYLCLFEGYGDYEQQIRRFWYTYRPAVRAMRGSIIPIPFGSKLEEEAKRILDEDRKRHYLPST